MDCTDLDAKPEKEQDVVIMKSKKFNLIVVGIESFPNIGKAYSSV